MVIFLVVSEKSATFAAEINTIVSKIFKNGRY